MKRARKRRTRKIVYRKKPPAEVDLAGGAVVVGENNVHAATGGGAEPPEYPTHEISPDNYFLNSELTPKNGRGEYDHEHIEAIDRSLLERHLDKLGNGHAIEMPHFGFLQGKREFRGDIIRQEPDELALIEGIHGLNPRITSFVDAAHLL